MRAIWSARSLRIFGFSFALIATLGIWRAGAQQRDPRTERNVGTVGIISGSPGGTYIYMATDLSFVHDDLMKYTLRVIPMVGRGSVQNIDDLLFLKGVDFAIVQEDVLAHFALTEDGQRKAKQIRYVTRLHNEEVHVLARAGIASISDLAGRKVSIGAPGSGHALTASVLLRQYRLNVEQLSLDGPTSLLKLRKGEIDAMIYVAGKPVELFQKLNRTDGLHFLPVDEPSLRDFYADTELLPNDYRDFIDRPVKTVMVAAVLAAFGSFQDSSDRGKKSCAFVTQFFGKMHELRLPGRHPKWNEVDIYAGVKNWQRLSCATAWLTNNPQRQLCDGARIDPTFLSIYRHSLLDRYPAMKEALRVMSDEQLLDILKEDRRVQSQQANCVR
jgi:TRAP transporter TAXI family solute receptor